MTRQAHPRHAVGSPHPFLLLAGHITLDFVNTVMADGTGRVDRVPTGADLAAWVAASSLGAEFGAPQDIDAEVFDRSIGLRGALKAAFDAVIVGTPVPDATLETLNAILRAGPGTELRRRPGGGMTHSLRVDLARDAGPLPWLLADAGAALLASDKVSLLRRCANHDTCVLMFLDTSRSHTRRWCSMELCGNRHKVAAHNARSRKREP